MAEAATRGRDAEWPAAAKRARPEVITHVVLFRPRAELSESQREALTATLQRLFSTIPDVRNTRVGPRSGERLYGQADPGWTHAALLEFEDAAALERYLAHPAHAQLAREFFAALEAWLIVDFELAVLLDGGP